MNPAAARTCGARFAAAGLCLAAVLLLAGCSINPALRIAEVAPTTDALRVEAPFHPQTEYQCGPAALATILGASGVDAVPAALASQVYLPGRQGSLQLELVAATRRAGRIPYVVDRTPEALFAELGRGRPVLVLQNLWVRTVPRWHYAVLVGNDPARNRVVLNSGDRQGMTMRGPTFLRTWDWAGRWAMVSLRPGELPVQADATRYLAAVADFEVVAGTPAATPAWQAAVQAWPGDARPHLALGNQAHTAGEIVAAAGHYRTGLSLAPDDPVLGNNYASTLASLGCLEEARSVLASTLAATPADGRWRDALARTGEEMDRATAKRDAACDGFR